MEDQNLGPPPPTKVVSDRRTSRGAPSSPGCARPNSAATSRLIPSASLAAASDADRGASSGSQTSRYDRDERSFGKKLCFSRDATSPPNRRNRIEQPGTIQRWSRAEPPT